MAEISLPIVPVVLERTAAVIARAEVASTSATRRRGLLGRLELASDAGMIIKRCSSVHTWFMRFAIDVVFLDEESRVLRVIERLEPFRVAWGGWNARDTLELPAGVCHLVGLRAGDQLLIG